MLKEQLKCLASHAVLNRRKNVINIWNNMRVINTDRILIFKAEVDRIKKN